MTGCYDDGVLRAAIDGELPATEHSAQMAHLAHCPACRARSDELRARAAHVAARLDVAIPDATNALQAVRRRTANEPAPHGARPSISLHTRSKPMSQTRSWRPWAAWAAGIAVVALLLALPPVRAAADQLLSVFRVQNVVFVPINSERMQQLEQLDFDEDTLFIASPKQTGGAAEPRAVASLDEAAAVAGFTPAVPALSDTPVSVSYTVSDQSTFEFQVNVESARELLRLAGVNDVTLPDALGAAPIVAELSPVVASEYTGANYELTLVQGMSPEVTLPEGVALDQLGIAALRLLGMDPQQAAALSAQIDWSTTLVFPFPADISNLRQVSVGGAPGLLVSSDNNYDRYHQIYWQRGDRFYVMSGRGFESDTTFIAVAESVR